MVLKNFIAPELNIPARQQTNRRKTGPLSFIDWPEPQPPPEPVDENKFLDNLMASFNPFDSGLPSEAGIREIVSRHKTPEQMAEIERKQLSGKQGVAAQFQAGIGDVYETASGAAKWAGFDWLSKELQKEGSRRKEGIPDVDLGDITWKSALDPQFWAKMPKFTARMTPFTLSLVPAMLVGYTGGVAIGGAAGIGAFGSAILGSLGATALSRPLESLMEAGGTYNEAKNRGMDDARADKAATNVFLNNLKLSGMDALELATAFMPAPAKLGSKYLKPFTAAGRVLGTMGQEAGEEIIQQKFQTEALGDKFSLSSPDVKQAALGGAIFGGAMGGSGAVFNAIKQKTQETMPPSISQRFETLKANAIKRGMTEERAELFALDEIAKTPQGKAIVEQATKWVEGQSKQGQVIPASAQAVQAGRAELGAASMAPSTSVQTGLPGIGRETAQARMLEESNVAAGQGGTKARLVDVETLKRAQAAKPLEGQGALPEPSLQAPLPAVTVPKAAEAITTSRIDEIKSLLATKGRLPAGQGTKPELNLELARLESQENLLELSNPEHLQGAIVEVEQELGNRSMPYHGGAKHNLFPEYDTKQLNEVLKIYESAQAKLPKPEAQRGIFESLQTETAEAPPAAPPPAQPPIEAPMPEEPDLPTRPTMADIQDAQTILDINLKPDRKRYLANLPVIKQAMEHLNPSAVANTPSEKFRVIRAVGRDQGNQRTQITMSYLLKMGDSSKMFGKTNEQGIITEGTFKGKSVNEIAENIGKYKSQLTNEQAEWLERANDIQNEVLEYAAKRDINIEEIGLEPGKRFASRKVLGKLDEQGELVEVAYLSPGPGRVGGKISAQKHRSYASIEEAQKDGFRYMPYDQALEMTVRSVYNAAADKQAADWLLTQVTWRTTGAPEELILKAEGAKRRTQASSKLLSALNRAVRGERVPESVTNAIGRIYPKEANELQKLIPRLQANEETATDVQAMTAKAKLLHEIDARELKDAINARARAREKAMRPNFGESSLMHPAFQGKMFTGPEAQETVKTLRDMLEPRHIVGLKGINSVNGLVRYFKLAGDASVMGIQLLIGAFDNPIAYGKAFGAYVEALFSEEFHANLLNNNRDLLARHPDLITTLSGTEFTEAFQRSGLFQKGILKIGGKVLGPFQRGFEAAIDAYGIEAVKAMEHIAKTPEEIQKIDQFINEMRGLTSSARLGVSPNWAATETATMLAPRYNRAIASYLADVFEGFAKTGRAGIRAQHARNSLLKMTAGVTLLWVALGFALGKDPEEIKESITGGLFTYNIGGTNIGPGTKIRSVIKLIKDSAKDPEGLLQFSMDNPGLRFVRGNLAPVAGNAIDLIKGKNYIGETVRDNFSNFSRHILIGNWLPIWVENVLYEGGSVSQRLTRGTGEFFGGRTYPETDYQTAAIWKDRYAAQDYGMKYEALNNAQRGELSRKHPDLAELEKISSEAFAKTGDPREQFYYAEKERLQTQRNEKLDRAAQSLIDGDSTKYDYDKERSFIRPYYSGGNEVLYSMRESNMSDYELKQMEKYLVSRKPEDIAISEYNEFYGETIEKADLPKDWDLINSEVELFLQKYPQSIRDYILEHKDDWIKDLPPAARQIEEMRASGIEDESWWDDYRGSTFSPPKLNLSGSPKPSSSFNAPKLKLPARK